MSTSSDSPRKSTSTSKYEINSFYDPDFTVEISNRMRVPDKISVLPDVEISEDQRDRLTSGQRGKGSVDWMHVPEKIVLVEGGKPAAGRDPLPEVKLESSILGDDPMSQESIQLMTPPRNLTLNEHPYPSVEPEDDLIAHKNRNQAFNRNQKHDVSFAYVSLVIFFSVSCLQ